MKLTYLGLRLEWLDCFSGARLSVVVLAGVDVWMFEDPEIRSVLPSNNCFNIKRH